MKFLVLGLFLFAHSAFAGNPSPKSDTAAKKPSAQQEFGMVKPRQKVIPLADAISNFSDHKGKMISFKATAKKVCEKKGCWMVLEEGPYEVRTLFKDYGFFVPKEILGQQVLVQGMLEQKHISAATLRHFMKDEGKKLEEIKKVKTGEVRFQFVATGVKILSS